MTAVIFSALWATRLTVLTTNVLPLKRVPTIMTPAKLLVTSLLSILRTRPTIAILPTLTALGNNGLFLESGPDPHLQPTAGVMTLLTCLVRLLDIRSVTTVLILRGRRRSRRLAELTGITIGPDPDVLTLG